MGIAAGPIAGGSIAADAVVATPPADLVSAGAVADTSLGDILPALRDGLTASDATAADVLATLRERVTVAATAACGVRFAPNVADGGTFSDAVAVAWGMLLADAGTAQDDQAAVVRRLTELADAVQAMGHVHGRLSALAAVAVAAVLEGKASAGWSAEAADQATLVDEARATLGAMLELSDGAAGTASVEGALRLVLLASDTVSVADDPAAMLRAFSELGDGAAVFCTMRLGGMDYQGWALNTELRAVTEYRNVPFDSFVILNGRTYAASEDGIFELTGDTDNGKPIDAWFRPFLTNFGTQKMKGVTDIWIGTAATGLYVKVHTKDPATGRMAEDIYPVQHKHGAGSDKGRVKVGRGLRSNYWALTVGNVAGAAFEVDGIEWKPLLLDRRQ